MPEGNTMILKKPETLVEVKNKGVWAESHLLSRKLDMEHKSLVRTIKKVITKVEKRDLSRIICPPKYKTEEREYRGQKFTIYLMNREFFTLVAMRLDTDRAFEWQVKFVNAFFKMESALLTAHTNADNPNWGATRQLGKTARRLETDTIQVFIQYALDSGGSVNVNHYYKHFTKLMYTLIGAIVEKKPKPRELLTGEQLSILIVLELYVSTQLKLHMADEMYYKDIYQLVKQEVTAVYANMDMSNQLTNEPTLTLTKLTN